MFNTKLACLLTVCGAMALGGRAEAKSVTPLYQKQLEVGLFGLGNEMRSADQLGMMADSGVKAVDNQIPVSLSLSLCAGSACVFSLCAGSVCVFSGCALSGCLWCPGSANAVSACAGSLCTVSGCTGSMCIVSGCRNGSFCNSPNCHATRHEDDGMKLAAAAPRRGGFAVAVNQTGNYTVVYRDVKGLRHERMVWLNGSIVKEIAAPAGSALVSIDKAA
jgi:hypothetical protein